jgi:hypothetical protein
MNLNDTLYLDDMRRRTPMEVLLHWIKEREAVRGRKERGDSYPWTDDPIIREWRFCNVRREDDRVTRWVQNHIRRPYMEHPNLWLMLCIARMINWPPTLEGLIKCSTSGFRPAWPSDDFFLPEAMGETLEQMAEMGSKVFTGAYVIPAPGKGKTKGGFIAERVIGQLWRDRRRFENWFRGRPTMSGTHDILTKFDFWGDFLAYQAVVDMRFCPTLLCHAADIHTWCAAGPGTIRGLNRLAGLPLDRKPKQDQACREIRDLRPRIAEAMGYDIDLSDVPNVLCEFDKYSRVLYGQGEPRARYVVGRGS